MDQILVLTAAPDAGLSDAQIAEARAALPDGGAARRLSPSAAEIAAPQRLPVALHGVDANWVSATGRRKRLLIADMDSTMITVECIDEVAAMAGVGDQVRAITEPAMRGEISFEEALRARVALMKGFAADRLQAVYDARVRPTPGARALVRTMAAHGARTALVSGGFTFFTERVAAALGFHEHRANRLEIVGGRLTGRVHEPVLGREAKLQALNEITAAHGLSAKGALAVGDGANDLAMIQEAGLGAAFRAKPVVADAADVAIAHGDLTALLYLQGYGDAEIVRD